MACCRFQIHWLINIIVLISLFALLTLVEMNWVPFPKIGFYCDDPKIAYKFNGDTVRNSYLFSTTLLGPLLLLVVVEWSLVRTLGGLKQAWKWYGQFLFGLLLLLFIVEACKSIVSEPRPHFLDTCRPDKAINCTSGYISDYKCTTTDTSYLVKDSMRSFPSGHSALGFYVSIFLIMFLQMRVPDSKFLLVPWLQCLCLMWGILCALTRITDRRHHWWDVLTGSVCGSILASYAVKRLCNSFRCQSGVGENSSEESVRSGKIFSSRPLLSSTSSYSPPDEKDVRALS